jgi:hypothetical protein
MTDITHHQAPGTRRLAVGALHATLRWALRHIATVLREHMLDERTRFLSGACDHADLKRHQELWDADELRSRPWMLLL